MKRGNRAPTARANPPRKLNRRPLCIIQLSIFIDKYIVEVFANQRQAMIAAYMDYRGKNALSAYSFGDSTTIRKVEIWRLRSTNQGFLEARRNRIWEPEPN